MSSSSLYEPEEDEASDSDIESKHSPSLPPSPSKGAISSPPIQSLRLSSSVEPVAHDESEVVPRSWQGTRAGALEDLRRGLTRESVETYSRVLEETISGSLTTSTTEGGENYNVTQDGIVTWTPREKEVLFSVLDRKGKNGIKEIAEAIGTKSELEVQEHLRLLHRGLERQHLRDRHSRTIVLGDVPAASDISKRCCGVLDDYAELVSLEEQYSEDIAGRSKHHDAWIIDSDKAKEIDQKLREQGEDTNTGSSVYLSASLLNMKKWTRLSERFFMNASGPRQEDNWTNIAFADEAPSMTADAFGDFYALAISVTRRLVQSSLFFAMSRMRNMRDSGHRKAKIVKSRDVKTALDVLNMKRDRSDFWTGLARRCSLEVADLRHKKGWNAVCMEYDEVEEILSRKISADTTSESGTQHETHEFEDEITDNNSGDDSDTSPSVASSDPEEALPVDLEDEHADDLDQKNSTLEEVQLWKAIGRSVPAHLDTSIKEEDEDDNRTTRRPIGERKTQQDLVDWRDRTLYRSDWEEYGQDVFDVYEEMSENRRKRRRIDNRVSASRVSVSSSEESWDEDNLAIGSDAVQSEQEQGREYDADDRHDEMEVDQVPDSSSNHAMTDTGQEQQYSSQGHQVSEGRAMSIDMTQNSEPGFNPSSSTDQQIHTDEIIDQQMTHHSHSESKTNQGQIYPEQEQEDNDSSEESSSDSETDRKHTQARNIEPEPKPDVNRSESESDPDPQSETSEHDIKTNFNATSERFRLDPDEESDNDYKPNSSDEDEESGGAALYS